MTGKKNAFGIAIAATAVLGIVLLFSANRHSAFIDQAGVTRSATAPQTSELPNPALFRIRLLVSNPN